MTSVFILNSCDYISSTSHHPLLGHLPIFYYCKVSSLPKLMKNDEIIWNYYLLLSEKERLNTVLKWEGFFFSSFAFICLSWILKNDLLVEIVDLQCYHVTPSCKSVWNQKPQPTRALWVYWLQFMLLCDLYTKFNSSDWILEQEKDWAALTAKTKEPTLLNKASNSEELY